MSREVWDNLHLLGHLPDDVFAVRYLKETDDASY